MKRLLALALLLLISGSAVFSEPICINKRWYEMIPVTPQYADLRTYYDMSFVGNVKRYDDTFYFAINDLRLTYDTSCPEGISAEAIFRHSFKYPKSKKVSRVKSHATTTQSTKNTATSTQEFHFDY